MSITATAMRHSHAEIMQRGLAVKDTSKQHGMGQKRPQKRPAGPVEMVEHEAVGQHDGRGTEKRA